MAAPIRTAHNGGDDPHQHPPTGMAATAARYERWGWLVLQAGDRLLLTTDNATSAVELPAALGADIRHCLTVRMLAGSGDRATGHTAPPGAAHRLRGGGIPGQPGPASRPRRPDPPRRQAWCRLSRVA